MAARIALTGGIGAGKSTVADRLRLLGAVIIDSDALAREVVAPGSSGLARVAERFGARVLQPDGSLDRAALASMVFGDPTALADLNAITHPLVRARSVELELGVPAGTVVVHDIPLLVENGVPDGFDEVVVVQAPMALRLERLRGRGMSEAQARDRMARQATDDQRRAVATVLLDNSGNLDSLREQVDQLWQRICS